MGCVPSARARAGIGKVIGRIRRRESTRRSVTTRQQCPCDHAEVADDGSLDPGLGIVLGAGGLAGHAFHAGTLAALAERGIDARRASVIVGTSAGSGVAALLRAGLSPLDHHAHLTGRPVGAKAARLLDAASSGPWRAPDFGARDLRPPVPAAPGVVASAFLQPLRVRPAAVLAGLLPAGRVATDPIGAGIRRLHAQEWPEAATWIVAVRLATGIRTVFGRDAHAPVDLGTAVEASSAIPALFAPVRIGGDLYVDGGVHSPTNADLLAGLGLTHIVVSSPMSTTESGPPTSPRAAGRLLNRLTLRYELRSLERAGVTVEVFEPDPAVIDVIGARSLDPRRMPAVAAAAYEAACARAH